jgi:predicted acetyltransferase
VDELLDDARDGSPGPDGFVPSTNLWWVQGEQYLGRVQLRHRLTPFLREFGGHIGYYVVPGGAGVGTPPPSWPLRCR